MTEMLFSIGQCFTPYLPKSAQSSAYSVSPRKSVAEAVDTVLEVMADHFDRMGSFRHKVLGEGWRCIEEGIGHRAGPVGGGEGREGPKRRN